MNVSTFIARRYMHMDRGNRFFSWISALSISGVAIGVAAMIVVWSVINGFEGELRKRFLLANAHVMAYKHPSGMADYGRWETQIRHDFGDQLQGISPFIHYETMVRSGSLMHTTLIRGTDPQKRRSVQELDSIIDPPGALEILQQEIKDRAAGKKPSDPPAVILGSGLRRLIGAKVGDIIEYVQPEAGEMGAMRSFKIVGTYDSGLKHYDNKLTLMSLATAQDFFRLGKRVTGLEIGLRHPHDSPKIAAAMDKRYDLTVREWQTFNASLFEAMRSERVVILLITAMVAAVAGFNILTTIFVAVSQKQRDISILKALGATNRQIQMTFVKQSLFIGAAGCLFGVLLAAIISKILEHYQFVDLPDLYLLAKLPMTYEWWVYGSVCLISISIAMLAGFFPATLASRINPVQGFRGQGGPS